VVDELPASVVDPRVVAALGHQRGEVPQALTVALVGLLEAGRADLRARRAPQQLGGGGLHGVIEIPAEHQHKAATGQPQTRRRLPWMRSLRDESKKASRERTPLNGFEKTLVAVVLLGIAAFEAWFFFFAGSSLPRGEQAMSQEKFEAVRTVVAGLNERDVDRYAACCTGDVELVPATGAIEGGYTGHRGIERFFADLGDAAPDMHLELERLEIVEENVLAFERGSASGRVSEVPGHIAFTTVYEFEGSKIRRIRVFLDRQQALEAVGLRE
jgi:hypothetical protein